MHRKCVAPIEQFQFANGTTWDLARIQAETWFRGTAANDSIITGSSFGDQIDAGTGKDTMAGGAGNDTYKVDQTDEVVTEVAGEGTDTVWATVTYTLPNNVENLSLFGSGTTGTGNTLDNVIDATSSSAVNNALMGGAGNDTYIVDSTTDTITENANQGTDTIKSSVSFGPLPANVENLILIGTAAINGTGNALANQITGNASANVLDGGTGADAMTGGDGDDSYVVDQTGDTVTETNATMATGGRDAVYASFAYTLGANVEVLFLTGTAAVNGNGNGLDNDLVGNGANNTLTGGAGNDTLDGGGGIDTLIGGAGNDVYLVDSTTDLITEAVSEGTDTIRSSVTYLLLPVNVENLVLTGTAPLDGGGNGLDNALFGNAGSNTLSGAVGNDTLDGGAGADTLIGGLGDDTYVVDSLADTVVENAGEGIDTIQSSISLSVLPANVENLVLTGSAVINGFGNDTGNMLVGNSGANYLDGGAGNDSMIGGDGTDYYVVDSVGDLVSETNADIATGGRDWVFASVTYTLGANVEVLFLLGNANIDGYGNGLDNGIAGNSGNNTLSGGAGNDYFADSAGIDTLIGGTGDDVYFVDTTTDTIVELAGEGTDTVQASVSYDLLPANVEWLVLSGVADIRGSGNALDNVIVGNTGANALQGLAGNDILTGGDGNDTFIFAPGFGHDTITDFVAGSGSGSGDVIQLTMGSAFDSLAEILAATTQVGADAHIAFDANTSITLQNVNKAALVADDFRFVA